MERHFICMNPTQVPHVYGNIEGKHFPTVNRRMRVYFVCFASCINPTQEALCPCSYRFIISEKGDQSPNFCPRTVNWSMELR